MPDQPSRRRCFQFRLRTLMIVVTAVAVVCATATWSLDERQRLVQERDRAIKEAELIKFAAKEDAIKSRLTIQIERQRREAAEKRAEEAERDPATQP